MAGNSSGLNIFKSFGFPFVPNLVPISSDNLEHISAVIEI